MKLEFEMSMIGEFSFYLGLQVLQKLEGIFISEETNLKYILKKFKMEDFKPVTIPMTVGYKLSKDDESSKADHKLYRSMIGNLLYLIACRTNIMLVVGLVARYL